jgi:hypothetical protein
MASYHCSVKVGAKGKAGPHASYISREGKYEKSQSVEKLEHVESGNMPSWAEKDPTQLWHAADQHERANGATYREIEVALPREMTPEQRVELVRDMVGQELGDKHAYTWAIHNPMASLEGGEQPHAHIMYSERTIDGIDRDPEQYFKRYNAKNPEKGGCRKDSAGTEERLLATRERWAKVQNLHLERHGLDARVDHRSLKEQGIDRTAEPHFGPGRIQRMTATQDAELVAVLERRAAEGAKERADAELGKTIIDLSGDLAAAKADRNRQVNEAMDKAEEHYKEVMKLNAERKELRYQAMLVDQARVAQFEAQERAEGAQRDAVAAQVEEGKRRALEAAAVASSPATLYPMALAEVTTETLATVPGILPVAAIQQAVAERIDELRTSKTEAPLSIAMLGLEVAQQPVYQQRMANADNMDARAQKTLDNVASMGRLKRMVVGADALEANAHQLRRDARNEREQVDKDIDRSPEMQAAVRINARGADQRKQIAFEVKAVEEIALRTERGESAWKQPSHVTRLPEAVSKVLDRAREIAASMVAKMKTIDVEALLKRAIDLKYVKPDRTNDVQMAQSKFVQTPAQIQERRVRVQEQDKGHDMGNSM